MRQETLWQGERRAARLHWWRQVLDRPGAVSVPGADVFDEVLLLRFRPASESSEVLAEAAIAAGGC